MRLSLFGLPDLCSRRARELAGEPGLERVGFSRRLTRSLAGWPFELLCELLFELPVGRIIWFEAGAAGNLPEGA